MAGTAAYSNIKELCPTVSVGIGTADLGNLNAEIARLNGAGARMLHFDVMDGCFVPMMTYGPPLIKAVKTEMLKDVHLMIEDPLPKLEAYVAAGADVITVHLESSRHIHRVLQTIAGFTNVNDPKRGILRGLAINPGTLVESVYPLLGDVDIVTFLAVDPGWSGQKFNESTAARMKVLHRMINETRLSVLIAVDGGITRENAAEVSEMGTDIVVAGSAIFDGGDVAANAREMLRVFCGA